MGELTEEGESGEAGPVGTGWIRSALIIPSTCEYVSTSVGAGGDECGRPSADLTRSDCGRDNSRGSSHRNSRA